jgi:sugar phosphate isomerase/epimerase
VKTVIGAAAHSDDINQYRETLFSLPVIEIENYLFPGFADAAELELQKIKEVVHGYTGSLVLSGPYIDLNPASPERLVLEACRQRFSQAHRMAQALGASEIIFLSTFIPIIYLKGYEEDWCARSISFWRSFMQDVDDRITISLGNTFEFHPAYLCRIAEAVGRPNFHLALDVGHFLVYSRMQWVEWLSMISPYCHVVYVHSNLGQTGADTHDEPYTGILTGGMLLQARDELPPDIRWIVKINNKAGLISSLVWLQDTFGST